MPCLATPDQGLAAVAYAPCTVQTRAGGVTVRLVVDTDYPFRDTVHVALTCERAARFPLVLRVPAWAHGAEAGVDGQAATELQPGSWWRLEREWRAGTTEIALHVPMPARLLPRPGGAVAVERGPLVYALPLGEQWTRVNVDQPHREPPHADWEVRPTTPWNYAVDVTAATLSADVRFGDRPLGERPFSPDGAPVVARVRGARVPEWTMEAGSAGPLPASPVAPATPVEDLCLVPYGCTSLRVTEFPVLKRG